MNLDTIYNEKHKALVGFAKRFTKTEQDAEEVVQEAYVKALRFHDDTVKKPLNWLYKIVRTTAYNKHRSDKVMVPLEDFILSYTVEEDYTKERLKIVLPAIEELPVKQAYAVKAKLSGEKFPVIARREGINYDTLKANYRHGLKRLQFNLRRYL